jgi:octaprenyl-diphosphate synthase
MLVFLVCGLHGRPPSESLKSALAVELVHTATLLHDDVVDSSTTRRGAPTVNGLWNDRVSILVGDFLFSRALSIMLNTRGSRGLSILSAATSRMSSGELLQEERTDEPDMDEDLYIRLVSDKTASLFSACCQLGALSAGRDDKTLEQMSEFGEHLGIAFQIRDDLLDFVGEREALGKPAGNDILNNNITLPLIYALGNSKTDVAETVAAKMAGRPDRNAVREIVSFVREAGGIDLAEKKASEYSSKALNILEGYGSSTYKDSLEGLVHFAASRDR